MQPSIHMSTSLPIHLSVHFSVYPSVHVSMHSIFHPSVHLFLCSSICLSVLLSIHPFIHLSSHLSFHVSIRNKKPWTRLFTSYWFVPVAGVPPKKLVEAHGTFSTASCTRCGKIQDASKVQVRNCEAVNTSITWTVNSHLHVYVEHLRCIPGGEVTERGNGEGRIATGWRGGVSSLVLLCNCYCIRNYLLQDTFQKRSGNAHLGLGLRPCLHWKM